MPNFHQIDEEYIYKILNNISGPMYKWDDTLKLYKYSNTLFPNKNYKKTFDPKSFMSRGDVVHFGKDDYRNNNKMIFDGEKLEHLHTEIDDYGSVPPTYVVGDGPGEFNIGDFEDVIDHNYINWLSKEKLKDIYIYEKNNEVWGEVMIKGKKWHICINMNKQGELLIKSEKVNYVKEYINRLIENYDNIKKRHPFNRDDHNLLEIFL
jgi:hypothetical protein